MLVRNEKVEHYIRIKTPKLILLRFWVKSDVNGSCGLAHILLMFVLYAETLFL